MSCAQDSPLYCLVFVPNSRGYTKMKGVSGLILPSNQCLSLIRNRCHSSSDLRPSDGGIYYLAHLLPGEKAH